MLRDDILEYLSFLISCAGNLRSEPSTYGPARLIDAARRMIELVNKNELLVDPELDAIAKDIDEGFFSLMTDIDEFNAMLDKAAIDMAQIVKNE